MTTIEPAELGRLFDAHGAALVLFARSWCAASEAEDIVQEAFVRLASQRVAPETASAWLYRVVRNRSVSISRSFWRRRRRESVVSREESLFASTDDRIDAEDATKRLDDLDPETRSVIVARIWGGLTFDEIAQSQGFSLTTAHRRYQDGLKRLHERLESSWIARNPT